MRIVSLLPSATEIVYALGLDADLAAVTDDCDFPAAVRDKPVVSYSALPPAPELDAAGIDAAVRDRMAAGDPLYRLDTGLIQELRPDLILAQDLCHVCAVPSGHVEEALATLGCRAEVVSLDPALLDDVIAGIGAVGRAAGAGERAGVLAAGLRERVSAVERAVAGRPRRPTLTLEWREPPFTGGHWVPDMVERAGGRPLLSAPGVASRAVTWDEVAAAHPEVVVFMPCGFGLERAVEEADGLQARFPGAELFAVDASAYFSRPGPRIVDGLEMLAWALHPDAMREPPAGRIVHLR